MSARGLRAGAVKLHRWLSLAMLALWLLQAVTGMICVFHWELDDATIAAADHSFDRALDLPAIGRRLALLAPPGSGRTVTEMWTSAGGRDRWDVTVSGRPSETVRIDGAGDVLASGLAPGALSAPIVPARCCWSSI